MRFSFRSRICAVAILFSVTPLALAGQPARSGHRPSHQPRAVHPVRMAAKPKAAHPHPLAGPRAKPHPFVRLQPTRAYHRSYLPYGYHHSRTYHHRYGSHHRAYHPRGRYGRTNPAFQKAQAEMKRLQAVALILNNI
ncbi:MAG TPA: hypothetical protein VFT74_06450, partial [Isosphaeraceae bacterium]|nr:hypothetical protein [Isosphaeraceae bacterium]